MQVPSGSRGAESYSTLDLDSDILVAEILNGSVNSTLPDRDLDFFITFGGFNLKDSIRQGTNTPLQFAYLPADCRIFYTARTVYNYQNLWNYVIDALYRNPSLCVPGSTTYKPADQILDSTGPSADQKKAWATIQPNTIAASVLGWGDLINKKLNSKLSDDSTPFSKRAVLGLSPHPDLPSVIHDVTYNPAICSTCSRLQTCATIPICSVSGGPFSTKQSCKPKCQSVPGSGGCPSGTICFSGYCDTPSSVTQTKKCNALPKTNQKQLETHPPSGLNVPRLPYGRASFGSSQSYRQYAPKAIVRGKVRRGSRRKGTGGDIN